MGRNDNTYENLHLSHLHEIVVETYGAPKDELNKEYQYRNIVIHSTRKRKIYMRNALTESLNRGYDQMTSIYLVLVVIQDFINDECSQNGTSQIILRLCFLCVS